MIQFIKNGKIMNIIFYIIIAIIFLVFIISRFNVILEFIEKIGKLFKNKPKLKIIGKYFKTISISNAHLIFLLVMSESINPLFLVIITIDIKNLSEKINSIENFEFHCPDKWIIRDCSDIINNIPGYIFNFQELNYRTPFIKPLNIGGNDLVRAFLVLCSDRNPSLSKSEIEITITDRNDKNYKSNKILIADI